ncbi:MAG TPA: c-type cytochrome [Bryobacteraceae bacterium]|jgi:mono/diheme cytochrome c family protein|nr:c-type cytochrome [Bryobacteraceae bacterium]
MKRALIIVALAAATVAAGRHGTPLQQAPKETAAIANPLEGSENARLAGRKLFERECAYCHGPNGEGKPGGAPPLKRPDVCSAPPGALFWVLRNGSLRGGMPSFAHLPEPERWQIVTYIRSLLPEDKHGK